MPRSAPDRARDLWAALAGTPVTFPASGDAGDFVAAPPVAERLPADHPAIRALLESVPEEEADESGLEEIASAAYAVREGGDVLAAAGFRPWLDAAAPARSASASTARRSASASRTARRPKIRRARRLYAADIPSEYSLPA
ncbi:hypothetical protein [Nonomuraea sp. NPDC003201]